MPVVTVAVPAHPTVGRLLVEIADTVAHALGFGPGDVIAVHTPTGAGAASGAPAASVVSTWHVVSIQGSDRGRENMDAAATAAEASVRSWCGDAGLKCEGVWTQWLLPMPA